MAGAVSAAARPVRVQTASGSYEVRIGANHLSRLPGVLRRLKLGRTCVVLSNRMILKRHGPGLLALLRRGKFQVEVLETGTTELSKSFHEAERLLGRLADLDAPGNEPFLLLAGGGVIGDLGGMVAGLYRRGIPYVQLPTTLLAQVDSSIGGKTAVDLPQGKNLVGLFNPPRGVFIELNFLDTVSDRQFRSGLAEVIKCGVIRDAELFSILEKTSFKQLRRDKRILGRIIARAVRVKADVVSADERESRGLRTLLNFGHTFGHALEAATRYEDYTHGEAVALGMQVAADLSLRMGLLKAADAGRIRRLPGRFGLPESVRRLNLKAVFKAMKHDKKWVRGSNRWVLPAGIGRAVVREGVRDALVLQSMRAILEG